MPTLFLAPGSTLDNRYVIQHFLAHGDTSEVYVARHRYLERDVVVKIPPRAKRTNRLVRERFEREAQVLTSLRHPSVVELMDSGEHEGALYLALEHMRGRTLAGLLAARGRLGPKEAISIGMSLAAALEHCHQRGVVHRDVKPDNVFILLDAEGRLKLFDFGVARLERDKGRPGSEKTREVLSVGTPEYMAPEALQMQPRLLDHRVDVYALGVLLYELLCGSVPFEGTPTEILVKLTTFGSPSLRSARPDLPTPLLAAVDRCLAYDPSERFSSMESVTEALLKAGQQLDSTRSPLASEAAVVPALPASRQEETRRHPRAPYTTLATLTFGTVTLSGRVEEISAGGVQFLSEPGPQNTISLEVGKRGELKFPLPINGRLSQVTANVRWMRAARTGRLVLGLEFFAPSREIKKVIEEYVTLMRGT